MTDKKRIKIEIMESNEKMAYEAPRVEVITVEVEQGYTSSMEPKDWDI